MAEGQKRTRRTDKYAQEPERVSAAAQRGTQPGYGVPPQAAAGSYSAPVKPGGAPDAYYQQQYYEQQRMLQEQAIQQQLMQQQAMQQEYARQ